jgi:hypothetical protein
MMGKRDRTPGWQCLPRFLRVQLAAFGVHIYPTWSRYQTDFIDTTRPSNTDQWLGAITRKSRGIYEVHGRAFHYQRFRLRYKTYPEAVSALLQHVIKARNVQP